MAEFNRQTKLWESKKIPYPFTMDTYFGEIVLKKLNENPSRVLQVSADDNRQLTCEELRVKSIRLAQNLTALGIKSSDVVGIICRHTHEVTIALYGCILIGAPVNPSDLSFTKNDIKHMFEQTKPKLVICDSDQVSKVREALSELRNDAKVYSISYGESSEDFLSFNELIEPTGSEDNFIAPKFDERADEKVLSILCSSGTTGSPKGVIMSHATGFTWLVLFSSSTTEKMKSLCFSPFFWGSGFFPHLFVAFNQNDQRIMPREGFTVQKFTEIVKKYKPTELTVPPMNLTLILQSDFCSSVDHSCLTKVRCMGSIVSEPLRQKFAQIFPDKTLTILYGMTECAVSVTKANEYKEKLTVGSFIFPNLKIKIVDEDGRKLNANEAGELCMKSNLSFLGYYNNPEASRNALDDEGFFKSGDVGYFDENGKLFIIDRKKEIVKCRGYQINLSEIESVVESIEGVEFVSVVGIPDPLLDTLPAALVVKRKSFDALTENFIADFVAAQLPIYKNLAGGVYFVNELPTTPSGKIRKQVVAEIVKSRISTKQQR